MIGHSEMSDDFGAYAVKVEQWFEHARVVHKKLIWLRFSLEEFCSMETSDVDVARLSSVGRDCWERDLSEHRNRRERIDKRLSEIGDVIDKLSDVKDKWLGRYLLLAFPKLGFFELENKRWNFAWDRLLLDHYKICSGWSSVQALGDSIDKSWLRYVSIKSLNIKQWEICKPDERPETIVEEVCESDDNAIDERLFLEMVHVMREVRKQVDDQRDENILPEVLPVQQVANDEPGLLDRTNALFQWNGKTYEWLTETMMDALELLLKRYPDKVKPSEMENKIGRLPADGFKKVFKTNRGGKTAIHPVASVVGGRSPEGWYLIK
jgi:hypothetical protein